MLDYCIKPKFYTGDYVFVDQNDEVLVVRDLGYCLNDNSYHYCCYPKNIDGIDQEYKESDLVCCRRN